MARIPSTRSTAFWLAGLVLVAGLLLPALPAAAQTITVTSAVPDVTDQGTYDLVVTIGGLVQIVPLFYLQNTIENVEGIVKVRILVNGETAPVLWDQVDLSAPLGEDVSLVR